MYSIYHFFKHLVEKKSSFYHTRKLEDFPYDSTLLACRNKGIFPDLAIRLNEDQGMFTGGELIELKDSQSYTVTSFNSTIPTGQKSIDRIIASPNSRIHRQMQEVGNNIYSLPIREVFYLIRGRQEAKMKVCLVHGSFFETIESRQLIQRAFSQVVEETSQERGEDVNDEVREYILALLSDQASFSKVRHVQDASVKIRFRIMTEVEREGNILHSDQYPEIKDNTLNFILPCDSSTVEQDILTKMRHVFDAHILSTFDIFALKHHLNGYFWVCQVAL
jgi:hypothetical protein